MTDAVTQAQRRASETVEAALIGRRRLCREGDHVLVDGERSYPQPWAEAAAKGLGIVLDQDCSAFLSSSYCMFCSTDRRTLRVIQWEPVEPPTEEEINRLVEDMYELGGEPNTLLIPPPLTDPPRNAREAANLAVARIGDDPNRESAMREIASEHSYAWFC